MTQKRKVLTVVGMVGLVAGIGLRLWTHSNAGHFAAGFLLGMSVVLLLAAVATKLNAAAK